MNELDQRLKEEQKKVEHILKDLLIVNRGDYNEKVYEAMTYSIEVGGKRLRPIILMATYSMFNTYSSDIDAFVGAIEMVHTYSLIHDDLPAMDNDALRRGKPTCHIEYGEDMAILAGDGLLNKAFEVMLDAIISSNLGEAGVLAAKTLGEKAGTEGMLGGQVAEIVQGEKTIDMPAIEYIHKHKTAALIEAAFMMGGYLAKQKQEIIDGLESIGRCIGMAFQIQDDLLDVMSTEAILGKPIMSDKKNNKTTYIDLKGIQGSQADVDFLMEKALTTLETFESVSIDFIKELILYIWKRDR